jgi:acetyl esterase/lipase
VFAVDYRLAPEHPFPAALDDAATAARAWLQGGLDARNLVIAGDSAGGGLTLALALTLRDSGLPLPRALVLFSPFVDLTLAYLPPPPSGEVMLTRPWLEECSQAYLAGRDPLDPLVSPIAADLRGLPPTLVQAGSDELLLGDSRRLFQGLQTAGVPARLEVYPRRWHVFQLNAGMLADADRALDAVARFVREPPVVP